MANVQLSKPCVGRAACRRQIVNAGRAWSAYFRQASSNGVTSQMVGGWSVSCTSGTVSQKCAVLLTGAVVLTLTIPAQCTGIATCSAAVVSAGAAWTAYYDEPNCPTCGPTDNGPAYTYGYWSLGSWYEYSSEKPENPEW